jgi:undecaprenyl phosphate N,N'-diacetylbacillosamine 1-phosphate transferase
VNKIFKRIVDISIALSAVIILLPVLAVIFVAVRLTSKGPVIFKQERAGLNGRPFVFYKFRTMKLGVDPFGPSPKSGDDPRLIKIGRFLREHSLDELPQLFNVLKGEMTIVGPRPLFVSQMAEWNQRQKKRLLVKPGITGRAQISGRGHLTREEKLELDVKYVETAAFLADIKIVIATIGQILGRDSIYEKRYSKTEYTRAGSK